MENACRGDTATGFPVHGQAMFNNGVL